MLGKILPNSLQIHGITIQHVPSRCAFMIRITRTSNLEKNKKGTTNWFNELFKYKVLQCLETFFIDLISINFQDFHYGKSMFFSFQPYVHKLCIHTIKITVKFGPKHTMTLNISLCRSKWEFILQWVIDKVLLLAQPSNFIKKLWFL